MIKQIVNLILFLFIAIITSAQGIQFKEKLSWTDVKAMARKGNKYIFIDAYAIWCGMGKR